MFHSQVPGVCGACCHETDGVGWGRGAGAGRAVGDGAGCGEGITLRSEHPAATRIAKAAMPAGIARRAGADQLKFAIIAKLWNLAGVQTTPHRT